MKVKNYFLRSLLLLALLFVPWVTQGQNAAKVSEYDGEAITRAWSSIVGTSDAQSWGSAGQTAGYVDIPMQFPMQFGELSVDSGSMLRVHRNGYAEFRSLTGSMLAPLYCADGYTSTASSVYTKSTPSMLTVEWRKVTSGNNSYTFQLKLYSTGEIEFCYGPMTINSSISVFAGLMSSDLDIFCTRGENPTSSDWSTLSRSTDYAGTRPLSPDFHPIYNATTNQGVVYTFTQPACVKPTSLTASVTNWSTVHLLWGVINDGSKYEIAYGTTADFDADAAPNKFIVNDGTVHTCDITTLNGGTTYWFAVRSYCGTTPSGWYRMTSSVTTAQSCPTPSLSNFSLSNAGVASWTQTSYTNISSIDIYYSTDDIAPDDNTTPSKANIAASTANVDLAAETAIAATSNTTWYVWFRGHCTVDGGTTTPWVGSKSFRTPCGIYTITASAPYFDDFESYSFGSSSIPDCWYRKDDYTGAYVNSGSSANSGSRYLSFHSGDNSNRYMALPQFEMPTSGLTLEFWTRPESNINSRCATLRVGYMTDVTDINTFVQLDEYAYNSFLASYEKKTVDIPNDMPSGARIAFYHMGTINWYWYIDDVTVKPTPSCKAPSGLDVDNVSGSSVTLSWNETGSATAWQIAVDGDEDNLITANSNPFIVTGLTAEQTYSFKVRAYCASDDQSDWSNEITATPTNVAILTINDGTSTNGYVPVYGYYVDDYSRSQFIIPAADITAMQWGSITKLTFYASNASVNWGSARFDVYMAQADGTTISSLADWNAMSLVYSGSLGISGNVMEIMLTTPYQYLGGDLMIGINETTSGTYSSCSWYGVSATGASLGGYYNNINQYDFLPKTTFNYLAGEPITCLSPIGLTASDVSSTTATLTWREMATSTQWEVKYGPRGFNPDETGNSIIVHTNPTLALGYLDMYTNYDAYVRAICDPEGPTEWSNVCQFKTLCPDGGEISLGDHTSTNRYIPYYAYYNYSISEQIYTASELGGAATISSLSYEVVTSGSSRDCVIYMGETDKSSFSNRSDWVSLTGLTQVYSGSMSGESGWQTLTLDDPFVYSGSGNLIVVVDRGYTQYSNNYAAFGVIATSQTQALYAYDDATDLTPENATSAFSCGTLSFKNNFIMGASCNPGECAAPAVAIAPSNDVRGMVTLTFTAPDENTTTFGYKVGVQGFDPTTAAESGVASADNNQIVLSLQQETTYDLYVYSHCTDVDNPRMVRYSFTTPFVPDCKVPNTFVASNVTYTGATISWNQADPKPTKWILQYGTDATFAENTQVEVTDSASYTLAGLEPATTYYVCAKSVCTEGVDESPWSTTREDALAFSTLTCVSPSDVTASDVTNSTAHIAWQENGTATSWTVKYGPQGFDPETEGASVEVGVDDTAAFELTGLAAYAYYDVYVKSNCTATTESEWSSPACSFRTACPEGSYSVVDGSVTYTMISGTNPDLHLTQHGAIIYDNGGPDGEYSSSQDQTLVIYPSLEGNPVHLQGEYNTESCCDYVYIYNGVGTSGSQLGEMKGEGTLDVTSTDATGALTIYFHSDVSVLRWGWALNATEYSCNTDATCFAPASVSADVTNTNVVTVSWNHRTDLRPIVTNFELIYGLKGFDPDQTGTGVLVSGLHNIHSYTITDALAASKEYDVYVRTVCGGDDHSAWTKASFTTYPSCWAPVNLTASPNTIDNSVITLSWQNDSVAPSAATLWEVAYGPKGFGNPEYNGTHVEATDNRAFTIDGLKHSSHYDFYVRAICGENDKSEWCGPVPAATSCGVWNYDDMPLVENFDGYNAPTSVTSSNQLLPNCWSFINGGSSDSYYPSIYGSNIYAHSGTNTLYFYRYNSTSTSYTDQYAILPQFGFDLDTLEISFYARFGNTYSAIEVGVMTNPDDSTTFDLVQTVSAPSTGYNTQKLYEVSFSEYEGNARYVAFRVAKPQGGSYNSNTIYLDDLTVKLREKVNTLPDEGSEVVVCNEFVMPDTTNGRSYHGNLNTTYVLRPAQPGYVAHITGDYDLENGYDFIKLYRGAVNANNLIGTYTGTGTIDFVTNSELWKDSGFVSLVFTTDEDNAFANTGFKLLVSCEQPKANPTPIEDVVDTIAAYTWTAGNGQTYTNHSTIAAAPDLPFDVTIPFKNVAGFDSVNRRLVLTLHPDYVLTTNKAICDGDNFKFYGNTYNTPGKYTVNLHTAVYGADSIGILNLTVNPAPLAMIFHNNEEVESIDAACDNLDLALEGRSDVTTATYRWEDSSTNAARIVNPHLSSVYSLVATNPATGCTSLPTSVTVNTIPVPVLTVTGDDEICFGQSTTLSVSDENGLDASYVWKNGNTTIGTGTSVTVNPTETTTYTVTATTTNASRCAVSADFTVTVNALPEIATPTLSVSELCLNQSVTLSAESKDGYSYVWNTGDTTAETVVTPTASGAFSVTVTDQKGCVNEFSTLPLTVHPTYDLDLDLSVCASMIPYTWGDTTLTADGNYDQLFHTAVYGCDSLVHLSFMVEDTAAYYSTRELCQGVQFTFGEGIYQQTYTATESTVITYLDTTSAQCPARYNLILTVNTHNPATVDQTACDTYTWPLNDSTYTVSGQYQTTLQTVKGCDSVVTLNLTVNYMNTVDELVDSVCDQYTWSLNGETYTQPTNEPTFTLKNQFGCDSVVTLNLVEVRHSTEGEDAIIYCASTEYTWINGRTYRLSETSGNVKHTLQDVHNVQGCDSIVVLNLTMNYVRDTLNWKDTVACDEFVIDTVACDNTVNTAYIRESGDYQLRIHGDNGGDVIARYHLVVNPSSHHTNVVEACLPYTWNVKDTGGVDRRIAYITAEMVNGAPVYNASVDMTELGFAKCSNIEVLRLTPLYPTYEVTDVVAICQDSSWTAENGTVFKGSDRTSGIYTWRNTDTNAAGCTLYEQVDLTVNPIYNVTTELTLCENQFVADTLGNYSYTYNDPNHDDSIVLTIPGSLNQEQYTHTLIAEWHSAAGCDSTVTITYTVNPILRDTTEVTHCYKYLWDANDSIYAESTLDSVRFTSTETGCDSISYLALTISDTIHTYDTNDVCTNYEYKGVTYFETKTFVESGIAETGCDSLNHITFVVHQNVLNEQFVYSNAPYTWVDGNVYDASTQDVFFKVGEAVCDSVLKLNFTLGDSIVFCDNQLPYNTGINGIVIENIENHTFSYCGDPAYYSLVGTSGAPMSWGIRLPIDNPVSEYTLQGAQLYFDNNQAGTYEMNIYAGGETTSPTLVGTKSLTFTEADASGWKDFVLDNPVTVDNQIVWITFSTQNVAYPATYANVPHSTADPFWINIGDGWHDIRDYGDNWRNTAAMINAVYSTNTNVWRNNDPQGNDTILYYTVNKTYNTTETLAKCDSYLWYDTTITTTGTYTKLLSSIYGCDSTATINLTINSSTGSTVDIANCDSYKWVGANDSIYTVSTIDTFMTKNAAGCDSTVILDLTINKNNGVEETVTACDSLIWHGQKLTLSDTYTHPFVDENGCTGDSVLNLTVNNTVVLNDDSIVNAAYTIYRGVRYDAPFEGIINDTVVNGAANGCDSVTAMRLRVTLGGIISEEFVNCGDFTWRDGNTYTWIPVNERTNPVINYKNRATGVPVSEFPTYSIYDEDGVVLITYVLKLTLQEAHTEYKDFSLLLSNASFTDSTNNHRFDFTYVRADKRDTTVYDTLRFGSDYYCDSIVYYTFHLKYNYENLYDTVCAEQTEFVFNGRTYPLVASSASHSDFSFTDNVGSGDDMVVTTMNVHKLPAFTGTETRVACDSISWNNTLYTESVVNQPVTLTHAAANGCDSTVTLNFTIHAIHNVTEMAVCDASYEWHGTTYTVSTTDTFKYRNTTDTMCYNVDTLKLTVNHKDTATDVQTACDSYEWHGKIYTESNTTDTVHIKTIAGCDSLVTLNLTINYSYQGQGTDIDTLAASITLTDSNGTYLFLAPYDNDTALTYKTKEGCDSIVTFHIKVSQYEVITENPIACGLYTWEKNNHIYQWISNDEKDSNAIVIPGATSLLPFYKDITADAYIYSRPTDTVDNKVYELNLNLNEAVFEDSTIVRFPQSMNTLTLYGTTFDFSGTTSAARPTADTMVYLTLPHTSLCGLVKTYNVHVVYNYSYDTTTVCYTDQYTWEDPTIISPVHVGSNTIRQTLFEGDTANEVVVTRTINVRPNNVFSETKTVCDSIVWNNQTYTTDGVYTYTVSNGDTNGCDSTVTLHLTVNSTVRQSIDLVRCDSLQWRSGKWYYASGVYNDTSTAPNGCNLITTLNLTINVNNTGIDTTEVRCDEFTWDISGHTYTASDNDITFRTQDENGCYTTNHLHLTINKSVVNDSILWVTDGSYRYTAQDGTTTLILAGESGSFAEHYNTVAGCDSTLNITIHVGEGFFAVDDATSCNSYTWRDGNTYVWISAVERAANNALYKNLTTDAYVTSNPIYRKANEGNYDSIYMLRLNLTQNYEQEVNIDFPISLDSLTYGDSTFYFHVDEDEARSFVNTVAEREVHFEHPYLCDSVHYLHINLNNNYVHVADEDADICVSNKTFEWRGRTINVATQDYDHAHVLYAYDTIGTEVNQRVEYIKITQHPLVYATERRTACDSYTWNDSTYKESTTNATFTFTNQYGCDSIVTLVLEIRKSTDSSHTQVACDSFTWNGTTYTESVDETITGLINRVGCDSTATLHLTINPSYEIAVDTAACDSYEWEDDVYTESGVYTKTLSTLNGCDSTVTLTLTINHSDSSETTLSACDSYIWNGDTVTTSGDYVYKTTTVAGCDSTATLHLTINASHHGVETLTVCDSTRWFATLYTQSGEYVHQDTTAEGCDKIDSLYLTVNYSTHEAFSDTACNSYTWSRDGQNYTASGTYTYPYTNEAGCSSTDTLHLVVNYGTHYFDTKVTNCGPYTWVVNGDTVATYNENINTSTQFVSPITKCDSVVFLKLTVIQQYNFYDTASACATNLPYVWTVGEDTKELDVTGDNFISYTAVNGCDSTYHMNFSVIPTLNVEYNEQVCLGLGYSGHGFDIPADSLPAAGVYTFNKTLESSLGCDSNTVLNITVGNILGFVDEEVACDSFIWDKDDQDRVFTESGIYFTEPYDNPDGCLSVDTLKLTVNYNTNTVLTHTACVSYTWHDSVYNEAGVYTYSYETAEGCPSTDTLHLSINLPSDSIYVVTACDSYEWNGTVYTESGKYFFEYTSTTGCPSIDSLYLTVNYNTSTAYTVTACDSYTWHDTAYTVSGDYTFDYIAENECPSTDTLHLTVNYNTNSVLTETACDSYTWNGTTYTESGNYARNYATVEGCLSVDSLYLTIHNSSAYEYSLFACDTLTWNGVLYSASGDYTAHLTNAAGCDSAVTLHLSIGHSVAETFNETACDSYTWTNGDGQTYTTSGTYTYEDTTMSGCSYTATLYLTVNYNTNTVLTETACDSYTWNGTTYTESGNYARNYATVEGCPSVDSLYLTIHNSSAYEYSLFACDTLTWNGVLYSASGDYTAHLTNAAGCDSAVTLHLSIGHSFAETFNETACDSYTWTNGNGQTYTTSGTYTYEDTTMSGCSYTATLNLTINNSSSAIAQVTACDSYTWIDGQTYTASTNTPTMTLRNAAGCDSIVTLNLTIHNSDLNTTTISACDVYVWQNDSLSNSGTYNAAFTNQYGCDSVEVLILTINHSVNDVTVTEQCDSYTWDVNGVTYTESDVYRLNFESVTGCDSIYTLFLTINYSSESYDTVVLSTSDWPYTYNGYVLEDFGDYVIGITTVAGCDSTIHLTLQHNVGIDDVDLINVRAYPNPTTGKVTISAENVLKVEVIDFVGRKVAEFENTNKIDLTEFATGTYALRITLPEGTTISKVVKR